MLPIPLPLSSHREGKYHTQCVALVFINRLLKCMCAQTGSGWWPPIDVALGCDARGKAAGFGLCCLPPTGYKDLHKEM